MKLRLSTKALKTIEKNGLDAVAKKAGIDLRKEWYGNSWHFILTHLEFEEDLFVFLLFLPLLAC